MRNSVRELQGERVSPGDCWRRRWACCAADQFEQERYTPSLALARFLETGVEAMFDARD
jgi:hypothetical protein